MKKAKKEASKLSSNDTAMKPEIAISANSVLNALEENDSTLPDLQESSKFEELNTKPSKSKKKLIQEL